MRMSSFSGTTWVGIAEIWQHTDVKNPSDVYDIVHIQ